ncbi:hypothetical protein DL771_007276 [Monosporascus sp. 5C6A]|nr:hypothetical protein DL771_007276 [Monosporascus sp. 5C6A]
MEDPSLTMSMSSLEGTISSTSTEKYRGTPTATPFPSTTMATARMGDGMSPMAMIPSGCKIKMLWNWETIDACFLSEKWRIGSHGAFAGLCIAVILMVVLLEALRRASKLYDRRLISQHKRIIAMAAVRGDTHHPSETINGSRSLIDKSHHTFDTNVPFRPNAWQQVVRALLHMLQFALAYWIMLMAMYYNGFIIICIFIGAFIGAFVFQWERMGDPWTTPGAIPSQDATGCCG